MPYKSQKQRGYFHAHEEELEKEEVNVHEWDKKSKGKKLPKKARKSSSMPGIMAKALSKKCK